MLQGHFANPIYESMYAEIADDGDGCSSNMQSKNHGGTDEYKGLLDHPQEDTLT